MYVRNFVNEKLVILLLERHNLHIFVHCQTVIGIIR